MEENRSFDLIGTLPQIQSVITIGKDSVRLKLDIPLHNQDQKNKVMCLSNLMDCVFKLTFTIEAMNQKDFFYPKQKEVEQQAEPVLSEDVTYQSPSEMDDINYLRSRIHLEIQKAGMELNKVAILKTLTGYSRERDCTITELKQVWEFITKDETLPITNHSRLRERLLDLISAEVSNARR
jgi:thiamine biosynthesis lipoprotein ApbE